MQKKWCKKLTSNKVEHGLYQSVCPSCGMAKNEIWLTRQNMKNKKYKGSTKKKTFAKGLSLSLDKPKNELDEILFPLIKKYE